MLPISLRLIDSLALLIQRENRKETSKQMGFHRNSAERRGLLQTANDPC
jgi:hypothetical protein